MSAALKGPWSSQEIAEFLASSKFPLRLACNADDGYPRVASLWYHYRDGKILCVTHRASAIARLLRKSAQVGFEIAPNEPPYHGVRGQGLCELQPLDDKSTLEDLLDHYLGGTESDLGRWLLARSEEEMLISIEPQRFYSWDYRHRMSDAVVEI